MFDFGWIKLIASLKSVGQEKERGEENWGGEEDTGEVKKREASD